MLVEGNPQVSQGICQISFLVRFDRVLPLASERCLVVVGVLACRSVFVELFCPKMN